MFLIPRSNPVGDRESVHLRHVTIEKNDFERTIRSSRSFARLQRRTTSFDNCGIDTPVRKNVVEYPAIRQVVVHHKNSPPFEFNGLQQIRTGRLAPGKSELNREMKAAAGACGFVAVR